MTSAPATLASLLGWYSVKAYGARGDNATDDTAAIQSAINACAAGGGGTVYFPAGTYLVSGAILNTSAENAQILLPSRTGLSGSPPLSIRLLGAAPPALITWGQNASFAAPTTGATIRTTATSSGTASVFGIAGTSASLFGLAGSSSIYFSGCTAIVEELTFLAPANPSVGFLNLRAALNADVRRCMFLGPSFNDNTQPTHATEVAVALPVYNNGAYLKVADCIFRGHYTGLEVGEHTAGSGTMAFSICNDALLFPPANHASHFQRLLVQGCLNGLRFGINATTGTRVAVAEYAAERHTSGWYSGGFEVVDPNAAAEGTLAYAMNGTSGLTQTFAKSGGANFTCTNLGN